jgi:hypothetical protein
MPLVEAIRAQVFAAERLHADDTTVPVLAKEKTRIARLWTYVRDDRPFAGRAPPAASFFYSPDRRGAHPERHLASFAGLMQADASWHDLADLAVELHGQGRPLRIATKYAALIRRFCYANGINFFRLIDSQGATEAAPGLGYADMVADITETGTTLRDNQLKIVGGPILRSQACLIGSRGRLRGIEHRRDLLEGLEKLVEVVRLPIDWRKTVKELGNFNLDPNSSDEENSKWWLLEHETVPYSRDHDAKIPVGTVIPGVIISGNYEGDRADIRGAAKWKDGYWSLELSRNSRTGSKFDHDFVPGNTLYMWVNVFDHTQTRHTRHQRPVRIIVQE